MRRILAAGMLAGVLLGAAACADTPVTPAPSGSATAAAAPAGADKKTVCDSYKAAEAAIKPAVIAALPKLSAAAGDVAKTQAVVTEIGAEFGKFQTALSAAAATSADPALKAAIEADVAVLIKAISDLAASGGDQAKIDAILESPEFTKAGEKVAELCKA